MDEKYLRDGIDYVKSVLRTMHESAEERSFDMDEQAAWDAGVDFVRSCLLYTSPSPRDGLLSRMPSSA